MRARAELQARGGKAQAWNAARRRVGSTPAMDTTSLASSPVASALRRRWAGAPPAHRASLVGEPPCSSPADAAEAAPPPVNAAMAPQPQAASPPSAAPTAASALPSDSADHGYGRWGTPGALAAVAGQRQRQCMQEPRRRGQPSPSAGTPPEGAVRLLSTPPPAGWVADYSIPPTPDAATPHQASTLPWTPGKEQHSLLVPYAITPAAATSGEHATPGGVLVSQSGAFGSPTEVEAPALPQVTLAGGGVEAGGLGLGAVWFMASPTGTEASDNAAAAGSNAAGAEQVAPVSAPLPAPGSSGSSRSRSRARTATRDGAVLPQAVWGATSPSTASSAVKSSRRTVSTLTTPTASTMTAATSPRTLHGRDASSGASPLSVGSFRGAVGSGLRCQRSRFSPPALSGPCAAVAVGAATPVAAVAEAAEAMPTQTAPPLVTTPGAAAATTLGEPFFTPCEQLDQPAAGCEAVTGATPFYTPSVEEGGDGSAVAGGQSGRY